MSKKLKKQSHVLRKLMISLIIILVLAGLGFIAVTIAYPKYIAYQADDLRFSEQGKNFSTWYSPTPGPFPSVYGAHDNAYYVYDQMNNLAFYDREGKEIWKKTGIVVRNPTAATGQFFNTSKGTILAYAEISSTTFHLSEYDKEGALLWDKTAPYIITREVIDKTVPEKGFFSFFKPLVPYEPKFLYGLVNVMNGSYEYKLINYNEEELFAYTGSIMVDDIYALPGNRYLLRASNMIVMLDGEGNQIWRREYTNDIKDFNLNGSIMVLGRDNTDYFLESISYDGETSHKLTNHSVLATNESADEACFYTVTAVDSDYYIEKYDSNFTKVLSIGPYKTIEKLKVNGNHLMFVGGDGTETFIYKYKVTGEETFKLAYTNQLILFFNDDITLLNDASGSLLCLNAGGSEVFTKINATVSQCVEDLDDGSITYAYYDNSYNHTIARIDKSGKQIFSKGTYDNISIAIYLSKKGNTVFGYRLNANINIVILDQKGKVILDEPLLGVDVSSHYNTMVPPSYAHHTFYVGDKSKVTEIYFERLVYFDRIIYQM